MEIQVSETTKRQATYDTSQIRSHRVSEDVDKSAVKMLNIFPKHETFCSGKKEYQTTKDNLNY